MKLFNWIAGLKSLRSLGLAILLALSGQVQAAPGTILFQDYFERSNPGTVGNSPLPLVGAWTVTPVTNVGGGAIDCTGVAGNTGCAGIDSDVPPWNVAANPRAHDKASPYPNPTTPTDIRSMFTRWNGVYVISPAINLTVPAAQITYWLRRGSDCFSEWPGNQSTGCTYTATITVTGNTSTSVSGITINGIQIMSGPSAAAAAQNTVAANIKAKINVAGSGFTATVNNNVVTITGANMNAYSALPIVTVASGTMTFTTSFSPTYSPNYGEEFEVQYLNSANTWVNLKKYAAEGPPGEEFRPTVLLPSDALWSGFKVRFYQPSGSGSQACGSNCAPGVRGYDYWHIDDVVVTELASTSTTGSFCDNFEGDLSRWTVTGFGDASIGSRYFQGGAHDLDIRWDAVTVTSNPTDMTTASGNISFWVMRGTGTATVPNTTGSDFPETGKNLVFEYLTTTANTWATLATFNGGGTAGQIYTPAINNFPIPANANKSAFQLRFRFSGTGTGFDYDYWHVDDVCIGAVAQPTDLQLTMTPTGTTVVPPNTTSTITYTVTNLGPNVEPGAITIVDTLPAGLNFVSNGNWSSGGFPASNPACSQVGQKLTCLRTGTLAANASVTLTVTVQAASNAAGSGLTNTATVSGQSNDTIQGNNTAINYWSFDLSPFDAYETSTASGAVSGRIFTKLAGTAFNLNLIAISANAIKTSYTGTLTVSLIAGNASCTAGTAALAGTTVTPASYTYTTGSGKDNGIHLFGFTSTNAYSNVQVMMIDNNNAIGCSANKFAIRPLSFTVSSSNANADNTGTNTAASPKINALAPFSLTADTSTVGYGGTPKIDTTKVAAHSGSVVNGTVSGLFGAANSGTGNGATGASFAYSEAGYFKLNADGVYDDTFASVDSAVGDCVVSSSSNTLTVTAPIGQYGCNIGSAPSNYFGRFIPDHFETAINQVSNVPMPCPSNLPTGLSCPTLYNGFVYSGQAFTAQVTAKNLTGGTTQNYAGSFAKAVTLAAWNALGSTTTQNPSGSLANTAAGTFSAGVATTSTPVYTLAPATTAPTNIYLRATEPSGADGVTSLLAIPANSIEGGVMVVSGRVKVSNAYGSELLPLTLTATAQYYTANGWLTSNTDNVTYLGNLPASYAIGSGTSSVTLTPLTGNLSNGTLSIKLGKPGTAGTAIVNPTAPGYLPVTQGQATFGVYKGSNQFIYQREAY